MCWPRRLIPKDTIPSPVRPFEDKILSIQADLLFVFLLDSDSGKVSHKTEGESELSLETLSLNDGFAPTPTSSNATLRSGSTSTSSVTALGELLTPSSATSQTVEEERTDERVRDSTTEIDLGDIDESRFSTVALNLGNSRRSSAASHFDRRSSTASFLLAKAQDTQLRHSLDGHRELQGEFEKAHANEGETDAATRGVDWGMFPYFLPPET